jgi:hypothetical protein
MFPPRRFQTRRSWQLLRVSKEVTMDRDERDVKATPDDAQPETEVPADGPGRSDDDSDADQGETSQGRPG